MSLAALRSIKDIMESGATFDAFDRPIFIIAPPRSGSTFLFDSLAAFNELLCLDAEADSIWWRVFPYDDMPHPSDYVGEEHISARNVREVRRLTYLAATGICCRKHGKLAGLHRLRYLFGLKRIRYLDKTITNCFHLHFLNRAFPDAQYIMLVRHPQANISSMIEGWGRPEFSIPQLTPRVRQLRSATVECLTYAAPPGWKDVVSLPVPQICAWMWMQHIEYALDFFKKQKKCCQVVRYEELVDNNLKIVCELGTKLSLVITKSTMNYLEHPPLSGTTVSAPQRDKWMTKNREAIESVRPMIKDLAEKIGYGALFG